MFIFSESLCYFLVYKCDKKCESLCKQSQKMVKECLFVFGTSSTPGKVGIGNLSVLFLSNPRPDKCENLM